MLCHNGSCLTLPRGGPREPGPPALAVEPPHRRLPGLRLGRPVGPGQRRARALSDRPPPRHPQRRPARLQPTGQRVFRPQQSLAGLRLWRFRDHRRRRARHPATTRVSFFRKSDGARENSRQISLDWVLLVSRPRVDHRAPSTTRSIATDMDTRSTVRGGLHPSAGDRPYRASTSTEPSSAVLTFQPRAFRRATRQMSTWVSADLLGSPADSIEAVIAIRGSIDASDLNQLESFPADPLRHAP